MRPVNEYYDDDEEEEAWVINPFALVWPPENIMRISPYQRNMTPAERLNAQARLTLMIGIIAFFLTHRREENSLVVLLWTVFYVLNQGVAYMHTIDQPPSLPPVQPPHSPSPPVQPRSLLDSLFYAPPPQMSVQYPPFWRM